MATIAEADGCLVEHIHKAYTLVYVFNKDKSQLLLGLKKRGFGKGKKNGFGGKVERGETIEQAARRELKEEANITANFLEKRGIIYFKFEEDPVIMDVHLYVTSDFTGQVTETDEMKPEWYDIDSIPYDQMWPDDRIWNPWLFAGKSFVVRFDFKADQETITGYKYKFVPWGEMSQMRDSYNAFALLQE